MRHAYLTFCLILGIFPPALPAGLSKQLQQLTGRDTTVLVWVIFTDKDQSSAPAIPATPRALARRAASGFSPAAGMDAPVSNRYIAGIESKGARRRQCFTWGNAASFSAPAGSLQFMAGLPYVKAIIPVRSDRSLPRPPARGPAKMAAAPVSSYGESYPPLELLKIPEAHALISDSLHSVPGNGITIAVFDNGFSLNHQCFSYVREHNAIFADSDFVDNDTSVYYPDGHGTQTLALIAGTDPGTFCGAAWGARFILARTEIDEREIHREEEYWAAAMVWAEAKGADIVSSSLGYRNDFTMPDTDYSFDAMDGKTTIVSLAAAEAARRGVLIVNAIGNEAGAFGPDASGSLTAPADVEDVVSVGAVDLARQITSFSSWGPSAAGLIKPDVVAPGQNIFLPLYDQTDRYTVSSGTSFSAPLVAGVCALIKQFHPRDSSAMVRAYLYVTAHLTAYQDSTDNVYGRGIPHALQACRATPARAYVQIRDSVRAPLGDVVLYRSDSTIAATTDSEGVAIIERAPQSSPETLFVKYYQTGFREKILLGSTPDRRNLTLNLRKFLVLLRDTANGERRVIRGARVFWSRTGTTATGMIAGDSLGRALFRYAAFGGYTFRADAPGYFPGDLFSKSLGEHADTQLVVLKPRHAAGFLMYPTVISLSSSAPKLWWEFTAFPGEYASGQAQVTVSVRRIDGVLVWQENRWYADDDQQIFGAWDLTASAKRIAPGTYLFILNHAGKAHVRKFMVHQ
jgi:hypothetical protein